MSHVLNLSASSLVLSLAVLALSGCQSAATQSPVDLVHPPVAETSEYSVLEGRVAMLEGQMKSAQPTLKKVEVMESHFKALSLELDRIESTYKTESEAPAFIAPVPAVVKVEREEIKPQPRKIEKVSSKPVPKKEVIPVGVMAVTSVRIGEQPKEITRIVLDTTKAAELHYDLDNGEGLLVIDIPTAQWKTTESQTLSKSPMIKSFHASQDDGGAHLVVKLKQGAKVVATARLNPSGTSGNRVYVDVAPSK